MGKLKAAGVAILATMVGMAWFYNVLYSWLWNGLVNATAIGWLVGYVIMFVLFLIVTPFVCIGLGLCYAYAASEWED